MRHRSGRERFVSGAVCSCIAAESAWPAWKSSRPALPRPVFFRYWYVRAVNLRSSFWNACANCRGGRGELIGPASLMGVGRPVKMPMCLERFKRGGPSRHSEMMAQILNRAIGLPPSVSPPRCAAGRKRAPAPGRSRPGEQHTGNCLDTHRRERVGKCQSTSNDREHERTAACNTNPAD